MRKVGGTLSFEKGRWARSSRTEVYGKRLKTRAEYLGCDYREDEGHEARSGRIKENRKAISRDFHPKNFSVCRGRSGRAQLVGLFSCTRLTWV